MSLLGLRVLDKICPQLSSHVMREICEMSVAQGYKLKRPEHTIYAIDGIGRTMACLWQRPNISVLEPCTSNLKYNPNYMLTPKYITIRPCSNPQTLLARVKVPQSIKSAALATHAPWLAYLHHCTHIEVVNWQTGAKVRDIYLVTATSTYSLTFQPTRLLYARTTFQGGYTGDCWSWPAWKMETEKRDLVDIVHKYVSSESWGSTEHYLRIRDPAKWVDDGTGRTDTEEVGEHMIDVQNMPGVFIPYIDHTAIRVHLDRVWVVGQSMHKFRRRVYNPFTLRKERGAYRTLLVEFDLQATPLRKYVVPTNTDLKDLIISNTGKYACVHTHKAMWRIPLETEEGWCSISELDDLEKGLEEVEKGFEKVEKGFEKVEKRLEKLEKRLEKLEKGS